MARRKPCGRPLLGRGHCAYERMSGKQRCVWHWLGSQPMDVQEAHAQRRLERAKEHRDRVPKSEWPPGERWCSGCQSFVPMFYVGGSRCKACSSRANHAAMVEKVYGIDRPAYDALFALQGGKCYICQRTARSRRLAVDHDHDTGAVRGLLCSDSRRGCNHAILGNIKDLEMARRIVSYLEDPPMERLQRGEEPPGRPRSPWAGSGGTSTPTAPF